MTEPKRKSVAELEKEENAPLTEEEETFQAWVDRVKDSCRTAYGIELTTPIIEDHLRQYTKQKLDAFLSNRTKELKARECVRCYELLARKRIK